MRISTVVAVIAVFLSAAPADAQQPYNVTVNVTELSRNFPEL